MIRLLGRVRLGQFYRLRGICGHADRLSAHGESAEVLRVVVDVFVIPIESKNVVLSRRNVTDLKRSIAHRKGGTEPVLDTAITRGHHNKRSPRSIGAVADLAFD